MRHYFLAFLFLSFAAHAQKPVQPSASEIKLKLDKLNFLGAVLYVAAHPDDENTRVITYMAKDRKATTAYLSMTRGDGGQNLIGPEIGDRLGLIRTQELLSARRIDGGQQYFTRAVDFGFSKSADETLSIWGHDAILSDVMKVYRMFQPDVILTRFPPDERAGHGHHTASAIVAAEAYDKAGDQSLFPDQVSTYGVANPTRLYTNTGRWWNTSINENTPGIVTLNVGAYSPLLGMSASERAAISRSQHKSQGFGSSGTRGEQLEFFEYVKGKKSEKDFFEGINTTWTRVKNGENVKVLVEKAIKEFSTEEPYRSIPILLQIKKQIESLDNSVWKSRKQKEVNALIKDCLGLYCTVTPSDYWSAPGERITLTTEIINRSPVAVVLQSVQCNDLAMDSTLNTKAENNQDIVFKTKQHIRDDMPTSGPYWLREDHSLGLFNVTNATNIGKPESDPALVIQFNFTVNGEAYTINTPVVYQWTDPVKGELYRPFEIVPPVSMRLSHNVFIFSDNAPKSITVSVISHSNQPQKGSVTLTLPNGWSCMPNAYEVNFSKPNEQVEKVFTVTASEQESSGSITAVATLGGQHYSSTLEEIAYDHIPAQIYIHDAEAKAVRLSIKKEGKVVGYIQGAGDEVPAALRAIGYQVWEMTNDDVTPENLKKVDAVVFGIRALNTNLRIPHFINAVLDYAKNGGTVIMQYNNNRDLVTETYAPFPLTLSRNRVTEEEAVVKFLAADHPVLNVPNKIAASDFDGWVQERGLYFPSEWAAEYVPILSMHDAKEEAMNGSLLVAKTGSGYFVYTGLSFFRELPAGVPGAYKLFANMVSLGHAQKITNTKVKKK